MKNALKQFIEAVEENNRNNEGSWKDWEDGYSIVSAYEDINVDFNDKLYGFLIAALDSLIRTEGDEILKSFYIDALCAVEYDVVLA